MLRGRKEERVRERRTSTPAEAARSWLLLCGAFVGDTGLIEAGAAQTIDDLPTCISLPCVPFVFVSVGAL